MKDLHIVVDGVSYIREPVKTHFITQGESYIDIIKKYVLNEGVDSVTKIGYDDFISISEKIIALCQNRVIRRDELEVGFWARFLSRFASHPSTGVGVGEAIKMQYAIHKVGLKKVLFASVASAFTKLIGKKGVFYEIVGQEVAGLDGFYDHIWEEYRDIGIELPLDPKGVCREIKEKTGVSCMIVDANDLGQEVLGCSDDIRHLNLLAFIKDNPAGQGREQTPIIIMHKVYGAKERAAIAVELQNLQAKLI